MAGFNEADKVNSGQAGRGSAGKSLNTALPATDIGGRQERWDIGAAARVVVFAGGVRRAALLRSNSPGLL